MTAIGVFALCWLVPAAFAVVLAALVRRHRQRPREARWVVATSVASASLVVSGLLVSGWLLPDALDQLSGEERTAVEPAVRAMPGCGLLPFARVVDVRVERLSDGGVELRYACGLTPVGRPRFTGTLRCLEGVWTNGDGGGGRCTDRLSPN